MRAQAAVATGVFDEAAGDAAQAGDAAEAFDTATNVEIAADALEQTFGGVQVGAEGWIGCLDVGYLVDEQEAGGSKLGSPGPQHGRRVGEVRQEQVAEEHVGGAGGEGCLRDVMLQEGNAICLLAACKVKERLRGVETDGLAGVERLGDEAGGEAGSAAEVDRQAGVRRYAAQEALDLGRKDVGEHAEAFGGGVVVAEGVGGVGQGNGFRE